MQQSQRGVGYYLDFLASNIAAILLGVVRALAATLLGVAIGFALSSTPNAVTIGGIAGAAVGIVIAGIEGPRRRINAINGLLLGGDIAILRVLTQPVPPPDATHAHASALVLYLTSIKHSMLVNIGVGMAIGLLVGAAVQVLGNLGSGSGPLAFLARLVDILANSFIGAVTGGLTGVLLGLLYVYQHAPILFQQTITSPQNPIDLFNQYLQGLALLGSVPPVATLVGGLGGLVIGFVASASLQTSG
jgi:hypothetical protein